MPAAVARLVGTKRGSCPRLVARADRCAQVDRLLAERNSQRSIVRVTGGSRVTAARLTKKAQMPAPCLPRRRSNKAQKKRWEVLELDETWTFMGHKPSKVWPWLAVERARRYLAARVLGDRSATTLDLTALPEGTYTVRVADLVGHVLSTQTATGGTTAPIATETLRSGMYLILIQGHSLQFTKRLVRE